MLRTVRGNSLGDLEKLKESTRGRAVGAPRFLTETGRTLEHLKPLLNTVGRERDGSAFEAGSAWSSCLEQTPPELSQMWLFCEPLVPQLVPKLETARGLFYEAQIFVLWVCLANC